METRDFLTTRESATFARDGRPVSFAIRTREFLNRIRGFSYSVGFIDDDGRFVPNVNVRHELIPEVCKELMGLYAGHQALIEQDIVGPTVPVTRTP